MAPFRLPPTFEVIETRHYNRPFLRLGLSGGFSRLSLPSEIGPNDPDK